MTKLSSKVKQHQNVTLSVKEILNKMLKQNTRKMSPMAKAAVSHYIGASEQLNKAHSLAEVVACRTRAQAVLLAQGFPTLRDEAWQYTKLVQFVQKRFETPILETTQHGLTASKLQNFLPPYNAIKLIFVDGVFDEILSDDRSNLPAGLSIKLTRAELKNSKIAKPWLEHETLVNTEPFGVLNQALLSEGFGINVAKNATIETPVFVLNVQTKPNKISTLSNCVVVKENAELTLVEQFVSLIDNTENAAFEACTNVVTVMNLEASARVRQVVLQQQSDFAYYFHNQFIFQSDLSDFNTFYGGLGSQLSRHQNHLFMNGERIENTQNSACLAHKKQVVDSRTNTQHKQVWGASRQLHKYVLADAAVGVFDGMIGVDRQAQKTDGQMDNKNLLLSSAAKMNSKPQLEIYADDVKCSHGCATGQINQEQIFYLQARGISRTKAIEMITKAFLMEPVEMINRADVQQWVAQAFSDALVSGGYFTTDTPVEQGLK